MLVMFYTMTQRKLIKYELAYTSIKMFTFQLTCTKAKNKKENPKKIEIIMERLVWRFIRLGYAGMCTSAFKNTNQNCPPSANTTSSNMMVRCHNTLSFYNSGQRQMPQYLSRAG